MGTLPPLLAAALGCKAHGHAGRSLWYPRLLSVHVVLTELPKFLLIRGKLLCLILEAVITGLGHFPMGEVAATITWLGHFLVGLTDPVEVP